MRPCPSCGVALSAEASAVRSPLPAEDRPLSDLAERWHGIFKEKSFFTYRRCTNCGLLYAPQYFSDDELSGLYASMPANMSEVSPAVLAKTHHGYFAELRRRSKTTGTLMEIGPDIGLFLEACVRDGHYDRYELFEPNVDAHAELRKRLNGHDALISTSMSDFSEVEDASVDTAVMIHVLDHLTDPVGYMKSLRRVLKPQAQVVIVTHDEGSLLARVLGHRWPPYCLQHPHLFRAASIRALLARAGYTVTESAASTNYFPVTYLMQHVAFVLGWRSLQLPKLEALQVGLKLGNMITFAVPSAA